MNNTLTVALILFAFIALANTHSQPESTEKTKFITVTGSADVVVSPDEIELELSLKEYDFRNTRKELEEIEGELVQILHQHGISEEAITFKDPNSYWYYWWGYRNERYKQQRFNVKIDQQVNMLDLMKALNIRGVQSLRIANTNHKDLQKLRKEVKIRATQAAKEKATYLLESVGEELGDVVLIEELSTSNYRYRNNAMVSNVSLSHSGNDNELENISNIRLQYSIKAKYTIK